MYNANAMIAQQDIIRHKCQIDSIDSIYNVGFYFFAFESTDDEMFKTWLSQTTTSNRNGPSTAPCNYSSSFISHIHCQKQLSKHISSHHSAAHKATIDPNCLPLQVTNPSSIYSSTQQMFTSLVPEERSCSGGCKY